MAGFPSLSLQHTIYLLLLGFLSFALAAPISCTFFCPSADENGRALITSTRATPYSGPYSIFDCVYSIHGAPIEPHTCRYYKSDGLNALGTHSGSACPTHAIPCPEGSSESPVFSAPEKVEVPPWMGPGNDLLYYRENHPNPTPAR